jgi:nucleoside-diphosphate-sugar epimerase
LKPQAILLTGATGFIGAQLAKDLCVNGFVVVAAVRKDSNTYRFKDFSNENLHFINIDTPTFKAELEKHQPTCLIHSAWEGVSAKDRASWSVQAKNIQWTVSLLELAKGVGIRRVISFGSQAEYGAFEGRINEDRICKPNSAYGAAKLASLDILSAFCDLNSIEWLWFRLFSVYGFYEGKDWLIPSVISNAYFNKSMDLTLCEQRYDYLHSRDLSQAIINVLRDQSGISGVFNLSSNGSIPLKHIIHRIKNRINPEALLNIGALPYRPNQVMHMEGDSSRFNHQFNFNIESDFDSKLNEVVDHWVAILNESKSNDVIRSI